MATLTTTVRLDERGRLVLPAELRHRLGLQPGDDLMIVEDTGGVVRLESRRAAARELIGLAGPADHSVVEELRAERRQETFGEDADACHPRQ